MCRNGELSIDVVCNVSHIIIQAVERRGDKEAALHLFNEAVRMSPDNALVRYRRAKILIAMRRFKVGRRLIN
jgi:Flp pilus assembly protein TadD